MLDNLLFDVLMNLAAQTHLFTIVVFDFQRRTIPVAWVLARSQTVGSITTWLQAFKAYVQQLAPDWSPACCIVDADNAEIAALRMVWGPSFKILICTWHFQRAFRKHLNTKIKNNPQLRATVAAGIQQILTYKGEALEDSNKAVEAVGEMLTDLQRATTAASEFISPPSGPPSWA